MHLFARAHADLPGSPDRWKEALEAVLEANEIASSASALSDAVHALLGIAVELLDAEQGSVMLLEDGDSTLTLVAAHGLPAEVRLGHRLALGESVAGRVLATGKPRLLGDVDRDAFINYVPKARTIASSVVVPLRTQGRSVGVLNLATSGRPAAFDDEDLQVAQLFADQAAAIINRARLHERAERRSSDLLALVEASRGLLGALELEPLLRDVLDGGARLAGAHDGFVCLLDPLTGAIDTGVFRGMDKQSIRFALSHPVVREAIDVADVALADCGSDGTLASIGLQTGRGTKGLLALRADPELVADRRDLLRAFAQQCSSALGAAELHSEILRKESELASIIRAVPNPIVLVDDRSQIVATNPAADQVFGISPLLSGGCPIEGNVGHPEVEALLVGRGEVLTEIVAGTPPHTYKVRLTDVRIPGAPIGRVLIMDDITAEREMAATQRDFVAMIGHELRTPLTLVKGFARTLLRRASGVSQEEVVEALTTIDAKAGQLEHLIEDLLYVSKIESRESGVRFEEIDVVALIRRVAGEMIEQYPEREIVLDMPGSLVWSLDETKVSLIVRHLLSNALKYSDAPQPVSACVFTETDGLRVDVVDRGVGIVSSDVPHIFERFRQLDGSSTRAQGGTGVGLYLCSQLVRAQEGRIWVESAWGKGSTFSFVLPNRAAAGNVTHITGVESKLSA
jgi:signal transduction histidine kinase/putative methionine-R-sulfoxide reductase with GAF domain